MLMFQASVEFLPMFVHVTETRNGGGKIKSPAKYSTYLLTVLLRVGNVCVPSPLENNKHNWHSLIKIVWSLQREPRCNALILLLFFCMEERIVGSSS